MNKKRTRSLIAIGIIAGMAASSVIWLRNGIQPMPSGNSVYVRYDKSMKLGPVLLDLKHKNIVRNPNALRIYSWLGRHENSVPIGTYLMHPGMDGDEILRSLQRPISQMVRLPETNWARRSANLLQKYNVSDAVDYLDLVSKPAEFAKDVSFPLPTTSLEGYLYPDTYDLPPLVGAHNVIDRQLKAFERKIYKPLNEPKDIQRLITIASLVEMEVKYDDERPIVAGIIENRLKKGMPLQIDAAINYGLQKWRPLKRSEYKTVNSPYNLYTHKGLPPGPICSPTLKSVEAALHPAKHEYLYYVALPSGHSVFAKTMEEHVKNIEKRKHLLRLEAKKP